MPNRVFPAESRLTEGGDDRSLEFSVLNSRSAIGSNKGSPRRPPVRRPDSCPDAKLLLNGPFRYGNFNFILTRTPFALYSQTVFPFSPTNCSRTNTQPVRHRMISITTLEALRTK